jgi:hypothetical protein
MKKPCTYSPEQEEEFSLTSYSESDLSSRSSGKNTLAKSSESEQKTDGFQTCGCGKEMSDCLIHPSTPELWIASMQDSLVKILAMQESKLELAKKQEVDCIGKSSESLAWFDHENCSWKTYQQSFVTGWELYSETWPRSATMLDGAVYGLPMLERIIKETDGGCLRGWPTPNCSDVYTANLKFSQQKEGSMHSVTLPQAVNMWPTPRASEYKDAGPVGSKSHTHMLNRDYLCAHAKDAENPTGKLNPTWVEWLMGWPIGWTNLKR